MSSCHVASLTGGHVLYDGPCGTVTRLTIDELPVLDRLSIKRLVMRAGAIREPHWHANATELAYCVSGRLLVSILDNESKFAHVLVTAGQMFHIESGALHTIENIGDDDAEIILAFRHERPEDFSLRAAFGSMTDAVLGNTYGLPAAAFAGIRRDTRNLYLVRREGEPDVPSEAGFGNAHAFDVEAMAAPVSSSVGSARTARSQFWPVLKDISMYSLTIEVEGMREPHWHPQTAEMGYVHKGHARMTILDPNGKSDTYDLQPGDVFSCRAPIRIISRCWATSPSTS